MSDVQIVVIAVYMTGWAMSFLPNWEKLGNAQIMDKLWMCAMVGMIWPVQFVRWMVTGKP